ncbi:MAG: hypothetical protein EBR23_07085 [Planctomycetia bacterium]|nr:hypothetical protein [Planctomycetia bacterium]
MSVTCSSFRAGLRCPTLWRNLVGLASRFFANARHPRVARSAELGAETLEGRLTPSAVSPLATQAERFPHHAPIIHHRAALETRQAPIAPAAFRQAVSTTLLAIPARQQWDENNGYCGETSIQSFALYFGTYASQYRIRAFINPDQQSQLLIGLNEQTALRALRLTFEQWNSGGPTPQWRSYLAWAKREIQKGAPVIGTLYVKGMTDPDYDHIVPFVGFRSSFDNSRYHASDTLLFSDNYATTILARTFGTLAATRRIANIGKFTYSIPSRVDYGCAVTGIVDALRETVPVRLQVDRSSEPNLITGAQPVTLNATLNIQSLVPGKTYSLLRYDDPAQVPDCGFLAKGGYTSARKFTATAATQTFTDRFLSDGVVTYRCVAS